MSDARERLQAVADELCELARCRPVHVHLADDGPIAAIRQRDGKLRLHGERFTRLPTRWQRSIIAHEIAHRRLDQSRAMLLLELAQVASVAVAIVALLILGALLGGLPGFGMAIAASCALGYLASRLADQLQELACDWLGWRMTGDPLACAQSLGRLGRRRAWRPWSSHPPVQLRVRLARRAARLQQPARSAAL